MARQYPYSPSDYDNPFNHQEETSSQGDEITPQESQSVINGIERSLSYRPGRSSGSDGLIPRSTPRDHTLLNAKSQVAENLANKMMPPEESEQMIKRLEKRTDGKFRRTYKEGLPISEVDDNAFVLNVGLTFLPGADRPQVNRTEQTDMTRKRPDQRVANWRVNTAGALLMHFDVSGDLSVLKTDQTSIVVNNARNRSSTSDTFFQDTRTTVARRSRTDDAVTIDSESVEIVDDLRTKQWDLQGMLIEVDASSLLSLMVNYRHLISKGGPDKTHEETRELLEIMIEDARRLCIRSPILFRMSTRSKIINSENTRYGIDHGYMFRTLTTSSGIKEIICLSASYYNSLDPTGHDGTTQRFIRPRFLQMIVLLLSLLNNHDLEEIREFLESTYKLKADRRSLELVFLKVIPLLSINSKVFIKALVPAFEGHPLQGDAQDKDQGHIWNVFVQRLLQYGYLLPGTVETLGSDPLSWIVKWPKDGFKNTDIFNNLQYGGQLKTMNEIPPIDLNPGASLKEVTVIMTDNSQVVMSCSDVEKVTCLSPGIYPVQEAGQNTRNVDLIVEESQINAELYEAIRMTNEIVHTANEWMANAKKGNALTHHLVRRPTVKGVFLTEFKGSGRITRNTAILNTSLLAVAYKVEGRKISRRDSIRNMARDLNRLSAMIKYMENRLPAFDSKFSNPEKRDLRQALDNIKAQIHLADQIRVRVGDFDEIADEPIAKCLYPEGTDGKEPHIWNEYRAWCQESNGLLHVECKASRVGGVKWLEGMIELFLEDQSATIYVAPLQDVEEALREDEVRVGDTAMLVGQYVIIAEVDERVNDPGSRWLMTNYLKVINVQEQNRTRRGANRRKQVDSQAEYCFR